MNVTHIVLFDLSAFVLIVFSIIVVLVKQKSSDWLDTSLLLLLFTITFFHLSNLLEWTTISIAFDPYEDFLVPLVWSFCFFSMIKTIQLINLEQSRNNLKTSEQRLKTILQNIPQKLFLKDKSSTYISCNEHYASDLKITPEEIMGKTDYDFFPTELAEKYWNDDQRIMEIVKTEEIEEQYIQNGQQKWVQTVKTPILDEKSRVIGILGIFWDITERKNAAEKITRQNAVLSGILEILDETLTVINEEDLGRICLSVAEKITRSEMGFIGEIDFQSGKMGFTAIRGQAWEACKMPDKSGHHIRELEKLVIQGLLEKVMVSGTGFFTNNLSNTIFSTHFPDGHPELKCFLGVPLVLSNRVIGMIGLANRPGGYAPHDLESMQTLAPAVVKAFTSKRSESKLRESEENVRAFFENLAVGTAQIDPKGYFIKVNNRFCRITGYSSEELCGGMSPLDLDLPEEREIDAKRITRFFKDKAPYDIEKRYLHKDGKTVWVHVTVAQVCDVNGDVIFSAGVIEDITERKLTEKKLLENEERYRALVETSQDLIWQCNREGRYFYLNPAWEETFGYPIKEMIGRKFTDFQSLEIANRDLKVFARILNGDVIKGYKTIHIGKDGKEIYLTFNGRPVHAATGEIIGTRGTAHDITELERAIEKYHALFNNMIDGFSLHEMIFDNEGNPVDYRFLEVNQAFERITGLNAALIIGKTACEVLPGIEQHWIDIFGHVASSGEAASFENYSQNIKKHFVVTAFRPAPGQFASIFVDLTDRVQAEQRLRESEERLRTILNSLGDAVIATDISGVVTRINPAAEHLTGWRDGKALGKPLNDVFILVDSDTGETVPDAVFSVLHTGIVVELASRTKLLSRDGHEYQIADSSAPIRDSQGAITGMALVFRDVTKEFVMREELRESEERYRLFYETSPFALLTLSAYTLSNPNSSAERLFGASAQELEKIAPWELSPERQPDGSLSRDKAIYYIREALAGRQQYFEWRHQRKDGTQFDAEVALARLFIKGEPQVTATVLDITDRKNALDKLKTSLHEKETLLQEIYHRTKNNMMVISSFLELQATSVDNEEVDRIISDSVARIRTMSLAHEMLYKGKNLSRINMRDYVTGLANLLAVGSGISLEQVELRFDIDEVEMLIDIAIPCGLIINELLLNCYKYAFPNGRKGSITIGLKRSEEKQIEMILQDNGVGLPTGFDIMKSNTLGIQLVLQIAHHQLHAKIHMESIHGLCWCIAFREDLYSERVQP
jgi:PAS domain S-box-containing protein